MGHGLEDYQKDVGKGSRASQVWLDRQWGKVRGLELDPLEGGIALLLGGLVLGLGGSFVAALYFLPRAIDLLDNAFQNRVLFGGFCGVCAGAVGVALFVLRKRQRGIYALGEITFAFATA